jgi:hypothetical protein
MTGGLIREVVGGRKKRGMGEGPFYWSTMKAPSRALRREDMRRSRTVRRGASAFRRLTLVVPMAFLVAVLASQWGAAAAEASPSILKHLAGCFEVSYRFVEDGMHDKDIRGDLFEEITLDEHDGVYAFQHYGIFKGQRIKHWREEWGRNPDGSFTQTVIGPFENPRYTCTAHFQFNQWRCTTRGAPKPQRDRERADYQTLDRENMLQITSKGWVQAENNVKRTAEGVAVANELGWNEYRRVDDVSCRPSRE